MHVIRPRIKKSEKENLQNKTKIYRFATWKINEKDKVALNVFKTKAMRIYSEKEVKRTNNELMVQYEKQSIR